MGRKQIFWGSRYELKYLLPHSTIEEIKREISAYVQHDPFSARSSEGKYIVRSIYFDNDALDFYYEKLDGISVRRKLRVRTYGNGEDKDIFFLEIKRRFSDIIFKERAEIPRDLLLSYVFERQNFNGEVNCERDLKRLLQRFNYNLEFRDLHPTALVVYSREAFIALGNPKLRITFDTELSTFAAPRFEDFYSKQLYSVQNIKEAIFEIKFDDDMPEWLRNIVRKYSLYRQAISKYCLCMDEIRWIGKMNSSLQN